MQDINHKFVSIYTGVSQLLWWSFELSPSSIVPRLKENAVSSFPVMGLSKGSRLVLDFIDSSSVLLTDLIVLHLLSSSLLQSLVSILSSMLPLLFVVLIVSYPFSVLPLPRVMFIVSYPFSVSYPCKFSYPLERAGNTGWPNVVPLLWFGCSISSLGMLWVGLFKMGRRVPFSCEINV